MASLDCSPSHWAKLEGLTAKGTCGGKRETVLMCTRRSLSYTCLVESVSGHFNQKDSPEARQKLRWDIEDKEEERLKKAKAAWKAYDDNRKKWSCPTLHGEGTLTDPGGSDDSPTSSS